MKKNYFFISLMVMGLGLTASSCGEDKEEIEAIEDAANLEYNNSNATAWGNYSQNVALLLLNDANTLYSEWKNHFAEAFKNHTSESGFSSAEACVEQILDGCIDIANEVGTAKIGDPVEKWDSGKKTEAVYAVESWYSWHSKDDYKNNILSIANSILGRRINTSPSKYNYQTELADGTPNSIMAKSMANKELREPAIAVWNNICDAWNAIDAIPSPFRNNIGSAEAKNAMEACATLVESLEQLKQMMSDNITEDEAQAIVNQFVDNVALPTYSDLADKNLALYESVKALNNDPTDSNFVKACEAWLNARTPWETSEAFLFGPVSELGLDPNMDSWPLDQVGISNLLKSQNWSAIEWSGDYYEENEAIEAAQSLRGYHTLEYLLFKDGKPRTK